jgi:hypothetical protein
MEVKLFDWVMTASAFCFAFPFIFSHGLLLLLLLPLLRAQIRHMSCGPATFAIAADRSVITWGAATNGELGYGPLGRKSSTRPDKVSAACLFP